MRITKVTVAGLFGELSHPVELKGGLTFLFGVNGAGKTTTLQIIDDLFNKRFGALANRPFSVFNVTFDNGRNLSVTRIRAQPVSGPISLDRNREASFDLEIKLSTRKRAWTYDALNALRGAPLSYVESMDPDLRRVGPTTWIDRSTEEVLGIDDIEARYGRYFGSAFGRQALRIPAWLSELLESVPVYFIGAQRISSTSIHQESSRKRPARRSDPVTVVEFATEMSQRIQRSLAEYAEFSQDLDSKFPDLLLSVGVESAPPTQTDIEKRYEQQNARRTRFVDTGLLEPGAATVDIRPGLAEYQLRVLDSHMTDIDQKFDQLQDLAERLELFLKIVNRKFRRKRVVVDKTSGIRAVSTSNGDRLELTALSSGEQQEIVLAYRLLFQETAGTLVLVDEPEISLHVTWQLDLIPDLLSIAALASLEFIVATHSPQVINDRDDLVVFLSDGQD